MDIQDRLKLIIMLSRTSMIITITGCAVMAAILIVNNSQPDSKMRKHTYNLGDTLYPDYALVDTLVVVNEDLMNRLMPHCSTDYEIREVAYLGCDVIPEDKYHPKRLRDYQIDLYMDTVWVWDVDRLVDRYVTKWTDKIDSIFVKDNL